jgi:hypothetical protein
MTARPAIARFKVTLEDVEPTVRRLDVPLKIRLDRLHLVLQAVMGSTHSHPYEFQAADVGWGVPDPAFDDGPLPAAKTTLADVVEDTGARTIRPTRSSFTSTPRTPTLIASPRNLTTSLADGTTAT